MQVVLVPLEAAMLWGMVGQGRTMDSEGLGSRVGLAGYRVQWVVAVVERYAHAMCPRALKMFLFVLLEFHMVIFLSYSFLFSNFSQIFPTFYSPNFMFFFSL